MRYTALLLVLLFSWSGVIHAATQPRVLVVGDSLSAAFGIDPARGWTQLLAKRLQDEGYAYEVVNASITGDTSRGALARLPRLLERQQPAIVIIEIGGNDGLRGISLEEMRANLTRMIQLSHAADARVLLLGMHLPPNYGPAYTQAFHAVYHDLAAEFELALVPFFMEGVAQSEALLQSDRIHPNAAAQPHLLDNVWPHLRPLLTPAAPSHRAQGQSPPAASH